jgi:hypothetical protein
MTIYTGSRYEYSDVDFFSVKPGANQNPVVFYSFDVLGSINFVYHEYIEGERLDQLAWKYYQRPSFWWLIPEYNPEIEDFTNIKPGTLLRIPSV